MYLLVTDYIEISSTFMSGDNAIYVWWCAVLTKVRLGEVYICVPGRVWTSAEDGWDPISLILGILTQWP